MSDLLKINVNEHTEKKGGLTYLSWAWAWAEVLKHDAKAEWWPHLFGPEERKSPALWLPDGSVMVMVTVLIKDKSRSCLLPVMDNRNNAIKNPDARKISDAIMRCMTKAIAMHGLGLYIYAGEDLPEGAPEPTPDDAIERVLEASIEVEKQKKQGVMGAVLQDIHLDNKIKTALAKLAFEVGEVFKQHEGSDERDSLTFDRIEMEELHGDERLYLWSLLPSNIRSALKREGENRKETA